MNIGLEEVLVVGGVVGISILIVVVVLYKIRPWRDK